MSKKDLSILLKKYLDGTCSEAERTLIESWLAEIGGDARWEALKPADRASIEQRIWQRLKTSAGTSEQAQTRTAPGTPVRRIPTRSIVAAASVLLLLAAAWLVRSLVLGPLAPPHWVSQTNTTAAEKRLTLEDGTQILLQPSATLYYPSHFSGNLREVRLKGSAFFNVAHEARWPFFVYSGALVTRVLGTSFWVKSPGPQKDQEVEVVSGKVAVYTLKPSGTGPGITLTPNQKVHYNTGEDRLLADLSAKPQPIITPEIKKDSIVFDNARLPEVVAVLERQYSIPIRLEAPEMRTWVFSGDLSGIDYYEKLRIICKVTGAVYVQTGDSILLKAGQ